MDRISMKQELAGTTRIALTLAIAFAGVAVMPSASAQAPAANVVAADVAAGEAQIEVTVAAIDKAHRTLTVKDRDGKLHDLVVSEEVKSFDKVKKGDQIVINRRIAVAVALVKDGKGQRAVAETAASAPLSNYETGRQISQRTTIVATVEKWDAANATATLRGPKGHYVDVKVVDPTVAKDLKKGDQVVAVVSQSVAVALWPKAEVDAARKAAGK